MNFNLARSLLPSPTTRKQNTATNHTSIHPHPPPAHYTIYIRSLLCIRENLILRHKHKGARVFDLALCHWLTKPPCDITLYCTLYTTEQLLLSVWMASTPPPHPFLLDLLYSSVSIINWPPLCCRQRSRGSVATRAHFISRTICKCDRLLYNKKSSIPLPTYLSEQRTRKEHI